MTRKTLKTWGEGRERGGKVMEGDSETGREIGREGVVVRSSE